MAAGGFLSEIGGITRVNGNLNLSRAIGDLRYKMNAEVGGWVGAGLMQGLFNGSQMVDGSRMVPVYPCCAHQ